MKSEFAQFGLLCLRVKAAVVVVISCFVQTEGEQRKLNLGWSG